MSELDKTAHEEFSYILVPADINAAIEERKFSGTEFEFKRIIDCHFNRRALDKDGLSELKVGIEEDKNFKEASKNADEKERASEMLNSGEIDDMLVSQGYQIIPLTLPIKETDFLSISCYVDSVGYYKKLPPNARAERICSDAVPGDMFISSVLDDGNDIWGRRDFTRLDYDRIFKDPVSKKGRWDQSQMLKSLKDPADLKTATDTIKIPDDECYGCRKNSGKLQRCGRCRVAKYCSPVCQRDDWPYHRRTCKELN